MYCPLVHFIIGIGLCPPSSSAGPLARASGVGLWRWPPPPPRQLSLVFKSLRVLVFLLIVLKFIYYIWWQRIFFQKIEKNPSSK